MKTKTFASLIVSAIVVANLALMGIAYASTTTGEVGVIAGGLSINSSPATETFGSVSVSTEDQLLSVVAGEVYVFDGGIEFEDTRDTGVSYSLTVTSTDFADGELAIDLTNLSLAADSLDDASGGATDCVTGFTTTDTLTSFADADDDGTSDSLPLVSASGQASITHCSVTPQVDLLVPAYTASGSYQSVLTFTIN